MKSRLCLRALLAAAFLAVAHFASAQSFPVKPVMLVVPYPAGGVSDVTARIVAPVLAKRLGQSVIVENIGGAGGAIGAQKVLNAPADGHVIFQGSPNEIILGPLTNAAVKFKSEDFRMLQQYTVAPMAILARKDLPASNGDELAAYARKTAADGKPLTYASVGIGSLYHLLGASMSQTLNVEMTHVPYKGTVSAQQDLVGGLVDVFITAYGKAQIELVQQGRLKFVASLSAERQEAIKQVPTLNESRALKGFIFDIWGGFFVKKGTPEPEVRTLHKALIDVLADPAVKAAIEAQGREVARSQTLEAAARIYADGISQYRGIVKSINLSAQ